MEIIWILWREIKFIKITYPIKILVLEFCNNTNALKRSKKPQEDEDTLLAALGSLQ
jgi:hypothetical protein